jgi:hypothetical protein
MMPVWPAELRGSATASTEPSGSGLPTACSTAVGLPVPVPGVTVSPPDEGPPRPGTDA